MRLTTFGILCVAAACVALGGEPAADVRTVSMDEFDAELRAIEQPDATTVQTIARRRKLVAARLVHREGRIVDVLQCQPDGPAGVCIEVRSLGELGEIVPLVPAAARVADVESWNKGDGIGWIERPIVTANGEVSFEPRVAALTDLVHLPDPDRVQDAEAGGAKGNGEVRAFERWFRLLAETCRVRDWHRAWLVYRLGGFGERTWVLAGRVASVDPKFVTVALDDPAPLWSDWPAEAARSGIGKADASRRVSCRIEQPARAGAPPATGDSVGVAIDAAEWASMDAMKESEGTLRFQATLRRDDSSAPQPRALRNPQGKPADFATWVEKFAAAAHAGDTDRARTLWTEGTRKSWVFPAVIKSVVPGRIEGRFCREAFFRGVTTKLTSDPLAGSEWSVPREQKAGLWGFDPKENHEFTVGDPELASLLKVNRFVDVVIDLDPEGATAAMAGPFPAMLTVWKLSGTRPPGVK